MPPQACDKSDQNVLFSGVPGDYVQTEQFISFTLAWTAFGMKHNKGHPIRTAVFYICCS